MNGSTWLIAFAGAILVLLCGGHRLVPQSVEGGRAKDVSPTRVAIVNVGAFLKEYSRARQIRAELEAHLMPYKNKAKPLQGDVETLQRELRTTTDPDRQRALENAIKAKKQGLEELSKEVVQLLEKRQEENTKTLWGGNAGRNRRNRESPRVPNRPRILEAGREQLARRQPTP